MKEAEARRIAVDFASGVGLTPARGTVFVKMQEDGNFELLVSADSAWLAKQELPHSYRGMKIVSCDRIIGQGQKSKAVA